ncbi:MAG: histidine kinase [Sphingomicrobium sp.]
MGKGFKLPSGRVIALGRLMLATLFLVAISVDVGQRASGPVLAIAVLTLYAGFAVVILLATWSNWWLDAKLAGPAHGMDIVMFMALVVTTDGSTSPYLTLFIFLMLAAAIRWSWHATALTAMLLTLLYLLAGLVVVQSGVPFEPQRFAVRTGHLAILSLILIWFGANQWRARFHLDDAELLDRPSLDESPLETGLRAAMKSVRASSGTFVWRPQGQSDLTGMIIHDGDLQEISVPGIALTQALATSPFVYDFARDRALRKDAERNLLDIGVRDLITPAAAPGLDLDQGLAIPVRSDGGQGQIFLEGVPGLSTDHIDLGDQIATAVALHLQRHAMLEAAEGSAEARSRLTLARDLHDSVVQFLAGAAFRLEAIKRSHASGRQFEPELDELKQLMLQEQRELRSIITGLRSGPLVAFNDLAKDLAGLAERLARQWDIACVVTAQPSELTIPIRLHLDAQQLLREAVANAARHAEAKTVTVELAATPSELRLIIVNDIISIPSSSARLNMPQSLKERTEEAGGTLEMARGMGVTKISIALPIGGRRR